MRLIGLGLAVAGLLTERAWMVVGGALLFGASYTDRARLPSFARGAADTLDSWLPSGNGRGPIPASGKTVTYRASHVGAGADSAGGSCGCGG